MTATSPQQTDDANTPAEAVDADDLPSLLEASKALRKRLQQAQIESAHFSASSDYAVEQADEAQRLLEAAR